MQLLHYCQQQFASQHEGATYEVGGMHEAVCVHERGVGVLAHIEEVVTREFPYCTLCLVLH